MCSYVNELEHKKRKYNQAFPLSQNCILTLHHQMKITVILFIYRMSERFVLTVFIHDPILMGYIMTHIEISL